MFHIGRCGSSVLADQLRQDPRFFWDGEVYRKYLQRLGVEERSFDSQQLSGVEPLELKQLIRQSGPLTYGCEIKFHHLRLFGVDLADFVLGLEQGGITHAIVLERSNHLAKVVSSVRAHRDGSYHQASAAGEAEIRAVELPRQIDIDFGSNELTALLQSYRDDYRSIRQLLSSTTLKTTEINYEAHIRDDPRIGYERICDLLGLIPHDVEPRLRRISEPGDLGIENADQVRQWLSKTEFEWMCL